MPTVPPISSAQYLRFYWNATGRHGEIESREVRKRMVRPLARALNDDVAWRISQYVNTAPLYPPLPSAEEMAQASTRKWRGALGHILAGSRLHEAHTVGRKKIRLECCDFALDLLSEGLRPSFDGEIPEDGDLDEFMDADLTTMGEATQLFIDAATAELVKMGYTCSVVFVDPNEWTDAIDDSVTLVISWN